METPMLRHSAKCIQCGMTRIFSNRSESKRPPEPIKTFSCPACEYEFSATDKLIEGVPVNAELIEEFFLQFC